MNSSLEGSLSDLNERGFVDEQIALKITSRGEREKGGKIMGSCSSKSTVQEYTGSNYDYMMKKYGDKCVRGLPHLVSEYNFPLEGTLSVNKLQKVQGVLQKQIQDKT